MEKIVILGGGVAGLAAACRLVEKGEKPLIVEAGGYPSHKMCGEFFSPECVSFLKTWDIHFDQLIDNITYRSGDFSWKYSLKNFAGTMSHTSFDQKLLDRALEGGAKILTHTSVLDVRPEAKGFTLNLSPDQTLFTEQLIVAVGRLPFFKQSSRKPRYYGFKSYFSDLPFKEKMVMFSMPGSYVGISEVEPSVFNVTGLTENPFSSPEEWIEKLQDLHLKNLLLKGKRLFPRWLSGGVPGFGFKETPEWDNAYFIGDASTTIPPASGAGLSLAVASGIMGADYALKGDDRGFKINWKKNHQRQIRTAKWLHYFLLRPSLFKRGAALASFFPVIGNKVYDFSRESFFSLKGLNQVKSDSF